MNIYWLNQNLLEKTTINARYCQCHHYHRKSEKDVDI